MDRRRHLGYLIKQIHISMDNVFNNALKEENLTKSQADTLRYLHFNINNRITQKDMEKYFDISNPTVTGIINRLEAKGFVKREVDKYDARVRLISITDSGESTFQRIVSRLETDNARMMSAIDPSKQDELIDMLNLILDEVDELRRKN